MYMRMHVFMRVHLFNGEGGKDGSLELLGQLSSEDHACMHIHRY
jgi:hypothetical protein